ncbi:ladderlectin-like [Periophthalmus magnuspinnatus]|uniref:ladderlectin-like n=1 Tax=Periophthalmus magnuspinnatus TaxID=409849 RepID=UPI00243639C2|nr:ladderlectin-like [Periophthalmus magnuspinnatus]
MNLLLLGLIFGAGVTMTTAEDGTKAKRVSRALCNPGTWCPFGGRTYIFISVPRPWAFAQLQCQSLGGSLAVIQNRETNDFLRSLSSRMDSWVGFSDAQLDGVWLWINSERIRFTNWCRAEPNNYGGKQDCAVINYNGENCWDDSDCTTPRPYVCERK